MAAESSLPTPTLKNLPKPETPFLVDDGMRIPVISSPGPSNKNYNGVYATPTRYITAARAKFSQQIEGLPRSMRDLSDANSDSSNPSDVAIINTPLRSSAHGQEGLQAALVECGYQSPHDPSSDHHFTIKDPQLKRLERLQVMEEQKEEPESPGDASPDRQFIDRLQDLRRQQEFKQYCEQTAGARVLQNISAPSTPTRLPSVRKGTSEDDSSVIELEGKIEKIAAQLVSAKVRRGEKEIGTSAEDLKIQRAKVLLDLSPRRCRPGGGTTRWAMMAAEYVDDYDNMMQVSAPVTPTRKSKASSTNHSAPMPRISLPGHERSTRGSPVVSRPGSTMEHTPGWTTVRIPLKRGEDQSKVLAEYHADRNEFLGFEGRPEHRPVPKSSHQGSSESELIHTPPSTPSPQTLGRRTPSQEREQRIPSPPSPQTLGRRTPSEEREKRVPSRPSPQTLGRRTPSEEREKRIPSPPSLRHARRSAGSLGRTLEDMQAMAGSAISRASTNERAAINREGGTLFSPDMDQRRWLGNDVVGYWGQNSGANHSKVYHEAQAKTEDGKVIEELDRAEQGKVADVHAFLSSLLRLESSNSSKEDDDNQLPASGSRTEKSLIVPLRDDNDAKADADAERPSAKREAGNEDIRSQSADKSSSNMESSVDARFDRKDVVPATDRDAEVFESGPETATETEDDFNCPTPTTFGFGSESDVFIKNDDQDDSEYPVLPRGSGHSLKGGKSRSPTRGGYAAAAKKKVVAKAKNQGTKETKEKKRSDGWSVGNEETWGSGRRNSNKK